MNILGKSSLCIYTKQSLLIINLHEQQASEFVQFSDLAKFWHFIIVNISVTPPLNPKTFDKRKITGP